MNELVRANVDKPENNLQQSRIKPLKSEQNITNPEHNMHNQKMSVHNHFTNHEPNLHYQKKVDFNSIYHFFENV